MGSKGSEQPISDMQVALGALIRASKKARILAAKTRTEFVVIRDGKLVREIPELQEDEDQESRPNGEETR
jgi:hypothetical protein